MRDPLRPVITIVKWTIVSVMTHAVPLAHKNAQIQIDLVISPKPSDPVIGRDSLTSLVMSPYIFITGSAISFTLNPCREGPQ